MLTRPPPGHRLHYHFRLSEPIRGNVAKEAKRLNGLIAGHMYGDPSCCNVARVLRVPGTVRWPTPDKPDIGPYILGLCLFGDDPNNTPNAYTLAEIERAFPRRQAAPARDYGVDHCTPTEEWVQLLNDGVAEPGRNAVLARVFGFLFRKDVSPDIAWPLVLSWNETHCNPPLSEAEVGRVFENICRAEIDRRAA